MSLTSLPGILQQQGATGGAFNPETDITWHSFYWTEGTNFLAEGYSDTGAVSPWPNETAEVDATEPTKKPHFDAVNTSFNNQSTIEFDTDLLSATFGTPPSYPISIVVIGRDASGSGDNSFFDTLTDPPTGRNILRSRTGGTWGIYAGTAWVGGGTRDTDAHLFVAKFDGSTGDDSITVDGTLIATGNAGSDTMVTLKIGLAGLTEQSLIGIYEGDVEADGSWSDMETWADSHYGITIA